MMTMIRTTLSAVIMIGFAATAPQSIAGSFGNLNSYFSFFFGDGSGIPSDVPNITGQEISADGSSVKLFGTLGPIDGARFASGFSLYWYGDFIGSINPGDTFVMDLTFDVAVTGGSLQWAAFGDLFTAQGEGSESARIDSEYVSIIESGQVNGVHLQSTPFTNPGLNGIFSGYLHVDWSGFSPTDTFTITIPNSSVDIVFVPVPEPSSAVLFCCGGALAATCFTLRRCSKASVK